MKKCLVGGQAVLDGVMMKNQSGAIALAVRKADGSILTEYTCGETKAKPGTFLGLPVVRGVVAFVESLSTGMRMITRSAEIAGVAIDEEPSKFEKWLAKTLGKSAMDVTIGVGVVLAVLLAIGLFVFLPSLVTQLIPWGENAPRIWKSLSEGVVRLLVFLGYICAISTMKDIKHLFMYHGAEHKTIACYEHDAPLTPENAMRYSRLHPRCGTNYLFLVMAISILFFALLPYSENLLLRLATRLLFLPVVAGISYEVLKLAAASDGLVARIVRAPGMGLQYLTTREPEPAMIEVAIAAFDLAMADGKPPEKALEPAPEGTRQGSGAASETANFAAESAEEAKA